MNLGIYRQLADEDFSKARGLATIHRLVNLLSPWNQKLLKFDDVRKTIGTQKEIHRGVKTVPVRKIVGSEGRYNDFTKSFLPKREYLRNRWTSIDMAHYKQINLPAVHLYEIGGIYFVRDGNHRISVARSMGIEDVDAIVTSLETEIKLHENMTTEELLETIIAYEKEKFYAATDFREVSGGYDLVFTTAGCYKEVLTMIERHQRYLNEKYHNPIDIKQATLHWFLYTFYPLVRSIQKQRILSRFPRRTVDDLFIWVYKHWEDLQSQGASFELATNQYSTNFGKSLIERLITTIKKIIKHTA